MKPDHRKKSERDTCREVDKTISRISNKNKNNNALIEQAYHEMKNRKNLRRDDNSVEVETPRSQTSSRPDTMSCTHSSFQFNKNAGMKRERYGSTQGNHMH